jgi:hypothetical protein
MGARQRARLCHIRRRENIDVIAVLDLLAQDARWTK